MAFKDKYTTADLITKDTSPGKIEKTKTVVTNDTYAIAQLLECLSNRLVR